MKTLFSVLAFFGFAVAYFAMALYLNGHLGHPREMFTVATIGMVPAFVVGMLIESRGNGR